MICRKALEACGSCRFVAYCRGELGAPLGRRGGRLGQERLLATCLVGGSASSATSCQASGVIRLIASRSARRASTRRRSTLDRCRDHVAIWLPRLPVSDKQRSAMSIPDATAELLRAPEHRFAYAAALASPRPGMHASPSIDAIATVRRCRHKVPCRGRSTAAWAVARSRRRRRNLATKQVDQAEVVVRRRHFRRSPGPLRHRPTRRTPCATGTLRRPPHSSLPMTAGRRLGRPGDRFLRMRPSLARMFALPTTLLRVRPPGSPASPSPTLPSKPTASEPQSGRLPTRAPGPVE